MKLLHATAIIIVFPGVWTISGHIGDGHMGLGRNRYFKFGPCRAGASDVRTVYYDDFRRPPNCRDVLNSEAACAALP